MDEPIKKKVVDKPKVEIKDIKKEEPVKTTKEEELNITDIINDIYAQLKAVGEEIGRINQQLETLKLNQLYIQQLAENALKATEVKE